MIEFLFLVQLNTSQPQTSQQSQTQSTYKAPVYQQQQSTTGSVPSQKQVEEFEKQIFEHPN